MDPSELAIDSIASLLGQIQKDEKIGTAYERYESQFLWDLGHRIREYALIVGQDSDVVGEIMNRLQVRSIRCQPVMLKNAETITRVWPEREQYIAETKDVPYGKLRDALKILDPDFMAQHKVSQKDRRDLIDRLSSSTFEEFRSYVKKIRSKYDPLGETVDFDEMFNDIYETTTRLREIVENKETSTTALDEFRARFDICYIENTRKLIAAMKSEDIWRKLRGEISEEHKSVSDFDSDTLETCLLKVTQNLVLLSGSSESRRDALRCRIGTSELGKLSTLLKAASTEPERQRYLRSRQMLETFTTRNKME
jgi:hypothetical protein